MEYKSIQNINMTIKCYNSSLNFVVNIFRKAEKTTTDSDPKINLSATSDSSLKNSWAAYGPGNSNRLEIGVID